MLHSFSFNVRILSEVHLNLRRHVSANVTRVGGPGGTNRRCDCDCHRPNTLRVELGGPIPLLYQTCDLYAVYRPSTQPSTRVALHLA